MKLSSLKTSNRSAVLFIGPPGTAKTTTCTQLSRPIIFNTDNNYKGAVLYARDNHLKDDAEIIVPHIKEDGSIVPRQDRFNELSKLVSAAIASPDYDTIVIDSLTTFADYAFDEVRRQQKVPLDSAMQIQQWGAFAALCKHFFIGLKSSGKQVIVTGHVEAREDESTEGSKVLLKYLSFPGQLRETLAGLFDEVWIASIEPKVVNGVQKHIRYLRTQPDSFREAALGLKSAVGIGAKFELDYKKLQELLQR